MTKKEFIEKYTSKKNIKSIYPVGWSDCFNYDSCFDKNNDILLVFDNCCGSDKYSDKKQVLKELEEINKMKQLLEDYINNVDSWEKNGQ